MWVLWLKVGIASLNEKKTLNAIPTFEKDPSKWFGYP